MAVNHDMRSPFGAPMYVDLDPIIIDAQRLAAISFEYSNPESSPRMDIGAYKSSVVAEALVVAHYSEGNFLHQAFGTPTDRLGLHVCRSSISWYACYTKSTVYNVFGVGSFEKR